MTEGNSERKGVDKGKSGIAKSHEIFPELEKMLGLPPYCKRVVITMDGYNSPVEVECDILVNRMTDETITKKYNLVEIERSA